MKIRSLIKGVFSFIVAGGTCLSSFIHLKNKNMSTLEVWKNKPMMEFFLNVSLNFVTKIFVIRVKGLEPATQPPLL